MAAANSLVLGLGNPIADADGFGPAVIADLREYGNLPASVELVDAHTDLLGHLDRFTDREDVVLVDAVLAPGGPGVAVYGEETFSTWQPRSTGVHGMSALVAVSLFRRLQAAGGHSLPNPRITLVASLVDEADFSRPPQREVVRAGTEAVLSLLRQP